MRNSLQVAEPILKGLKSTNQAELLRHLLDITLPLFQTHRNVLKIAVVEEMKHPASGPLFEYFKGYIATGFKYFDKNDMAEKGFSAYIFFMVLFPILGFSALGDEWCKQTKTKPTQFNKTFSQWMTDSLDQYLTGMDKQA
jgi:hypothetical protein